MNSDLSPIEDSVADLAAYLGGSAVSGTSETVTWNSVTSDSRRVTSGTVFVAYCGVSVDGHDFLEDAVQNGAVLCIISDESRAVSHVPTIVVSEPRAALSLLAARLYSYPSDAMKMIGITGTNGKTTTHWLTYHALSRLGYSPVRFGTLGCYIEGELDDRHSMTSPDADILQRYLGMARDHNKDAAVLEVSSHALLQYRCAGIRFQVGVFTNLTPDHLDYHPDMESYFEAKGLLFEQSESCVANIDCDYGSRLARSLEGKMPLISFGRSEEALLAIKNFTQSSTGSTLTLEYESSSYDVATDFIGEYNGYNLACTFAICLALGHDAGEVADALQQSPQVPGRLERYSYNGAKVIIDYAYAPDALQNVLETLRSVTESRLWVLFGCGGERDRGRRTGMGKVAKELADRVALTSDNPRREDPQQIMDDILSSGLQPEFIEPDRPAAIRRCMKELSEGDILVVAGKGHEEYQILGTEKIHLSDREEVFKVINGN